MNNTVTKFVAVAVLQIFWSTVASGQSLTPMRGEIKSFAPEFIVRVVVGNPYDNAVNFDIHAYDENFNPVDAHIVPSRVRLSAKDTRQITVRMPFLGQPQRKFRVCVEGMFGDLKKSAVRTQVCGRFMAQHFGS